MTDNIRIKGDEQEFKSIFTKMYFESLYIELLCNTNRKNFIEIPHDHVTNQLFIVKSGEFRFKTDSLDLNLKQGDYLIVSPHTKHMLNSLNDTSDGFFVYFVIHNNQSDIELLNNDVIHKKLIGFEKLFVLETIQELERISKIQNNKSVSSRQKMLLCTIFSYILEHNVVLPPFSENEADKRISLYNKIEDYLYENYMEQITLDELCASLSYSRTQMRRILNECFGMTFTEKLRDVRLDAAKLLLNNTELTIEEISEQCGYETRQGFESMFTKFVGTTPKQFRKQKVEQQC